MLKYGLVFVSIAYLVHHFLSPILLPDPEGQIYSLLTKDFATDLTRKEAREPPDHLYDYNSETYHFGRWIKPMKYPFLHSITLFQKYLQKKEWDAVVVSTGRHLIGVGIANFNYVSVAFVYLYDSFEELSFVSQSFPVPLSVFTTMSNSSIEGCSTFSFMSTSLEICSKDRPGNGEISKRGLVQWTVIGETSFSNELHFKYHFIMGSPHQLSDGCVLSYMIGPKRPAYTHKSGGLEVKGEAVLTNLTTNSEKLRVSLNQSVGLRDWTRGMHSRFTSWFWVALSWYSDDGDRLGINLRSVPLFFVFSNL